VDPTPTLLPSRDTSPPGPAEPNASTAPRADSVPPSACTITPPPLGPLASSFDAASRVMSCFALRTIFPFSPTAAVVALTTPAFLIVDP
jgi:hypothetical protein